MPLYDYQCRDCSSQFELFHKIADLDLAHECEKCGSENTFRVLTPTRISADYPGYQCPISGKWIEGKKAHRENLAKHDCRVLETGETEMAMKRKKAMNEANDAMIEAAAVRAIEALPQQKLEILAGELQHGAGTDPSSHLVRQTATS